MIVSSPAAARSPRRRTVTGTITPVAPVQEMTTSATASSASRSARETPRAPYSTARRSALPVVRLATAMPAAPRRATVAVARPAIAPAPRISTCLPARSPSAAWLRSRAALTSVGAARSMSVSARARLPTRSACWKSTLRAGPAVPSSWPRRERVPGLAEDLALADGHRVQAGDDAEEVGDGAVVVVDVEVRQHRLGGLAGAVDQQPRHVLDAAVEAVDVGVDLEPVAGRDDRRLGDVLARGDASISLRTPSASSGDLLEQPDRRGPVGDPHNQDTHAVAAFRCSW